MNRDLTMMAAMLFGVIPMSATLPSTWAIVLQAAVGGMSFGAHLVMWLDRKKRALA